MYVGRSFYVIFFSKLQYIKCYTTFIYHFSYISYVFRRVFDIIMVNIRYGPETTHEERAQRRLQVVYSKQTRERQIFMQELKEIRKQRDRCIMRTIINNVGPKWYHSLSVPQRTALDTLEFSIYQDILEGRPIRTAAIMRELGLFPRPNHLDLMNCVYLGRKDPKEMLAQLFHMTYGHSIDGKRLSYCLNAKLMLSGILYLGLQKLIESLKNKFHVEPKAISIKSKPKRKIKPPLESPYLQEMVAYLYQRPKPKRFRPSPLPNLDDLNEPYEEEPPIPKPPPPPPPPPPPKKRLARGYCDKLAGVINIEPHSSVTALTMKTTTRSLQRRKGRGSKMCLTEVKKTFGISMAKSKKGSRRRKLHAPNTGIWNAQYMITGVYRVRGKSFFILGNVSILPPLGDLIHGGYKYMAGECINIHCGFRGLPPPPKPEPCDCIKTWHDSVFEYVKRTKCFCGHYYDYGNEGSFLPEELPFFEKPTKNKPFQFNYQTIYNLDPKHLHVEKEFKRIWDTDSALHVDDGTAMEKKDKKKKKTKRSSATCLGQAPTPEDYLKCALRHMKRDNIAAGLPDIHLVPELKEWMRNRIYGPYTRIQKSELLRKSSSFWQAFLMLAAKGFGHVSPPQDPTYAGHTTWVHKQDLNDKFRKFTHRYRLDLYRSYARVNNMLWATMCQAEFPDKKFREIYFSYLFGRVEDLQLMHPYSSKESTERKYMLANKRYCCPPAGVENLE